MKLRRLFIFSESGLPSPSRWPKADMFRGINGAKFGQFGMPLGPPRGDEVNVPPIVHPPVGLRLFHGTSSSTEFSIPRGPASFSLSRDTALGYAQNHGDGVRPRVKSFILTKTGNFVDHPGVGPGADDAAAWLSRWQREVMGDDSYIPWGNLGTALVPKGLALLQKAGYDGIRMSTLDDGGEEISIFEPDSFVKVIGDEP